MVFQMAASLLGWFASPIVYLVGTLFHGAYSAF